MLLCLIFSRRQRFCNCQWLIEVFLYSGQRNGNGLPRAASSCRELSKRLGDPGDESHSYSDWQRYLEKFVDACETQLGNIAMVLFGFFFCMISFQVYLLYSTAVPSPELVDHIRDLYHKRVPDVRFLIPVLNGLSKVRLLIRRLFWNIFKLTRWYLPLTTVKFVTFR